MKRWIAWILALVLVFSMTGCDVQNDGEAQQDQTEDTASGVTYTINELGLPVVSKPIVLRVMGTKHPIQGDWQDMSLWKWLSEQTGIIFEFNTPSVQVYGEKKNLAFASKDLPDVFIGGGITTGDELRYGSKLLVPLDEYLYAAPNLQKMYEEHPDWLKASQHEDGHVYSLSQDLVGYGLYRYSWINRQWLDNLGLSMPETVDELYNVLQQFKTGDPNGNKLQDEIPLSFSSETYETLRSTLLAAFGYLSGSYEVKDGKMVFAPTQGNYKEYLKFMKQLWAEGLIDPDAFSQNLQQQTAKGYEGRLGVFSYIGDYIVVGTELNRQYQVLAPLTSAVNSEKMAHTSSPLITGAAAITTSNKYPEITMCLLDWFYSETGALCMINGVEGTDWERTEDGGMTFFVPDGINKEEYRGGKITPDCGTFMPRYSEPAQAVITAGAYDQNLPFEANIHYQVMEAVKPYAKVAIPNLIFTEDEHDLLTSLSTDISNYITQAEAEFITGARDIDASWEEYVTTLERMGVTDLLGIYQAAYDRLNG